MWNQGENVKFARIKEELADVIIYALDLARQYNFSVDDIVREKIKKNAEKYPVAKSKGIAKKYTEL